MACAANSTSQPAEAKPCSRTQHQLDQLLEKADKGKLKFERYFFTNDQTPPPFAKRGDIPSNVVRCLECGCTIGKHGTGLNARHLAAGDDSPLNIMKALLDPRKSENTPTVVQSQVRQHPCCVCQKPNPSCAHILRTRKDAADIHVPYDEPSNFLPLCGTKGSFPSCHDAFDTQQLCFIAIPDESVHATETTRRWLVFTRDSYLGYLKDNKSCAMVCLDTAPSRRILHVHARLFWKLVNKETEDRLFNEAKSILKGPAVSIDEWLAATTPPQQESPDATLTCKKCSSKRDLFMDKDSIAYCAACWVKYAVCDICPHKTLSSEADVKSHFLGKNHQKKLLSALK